MSSTGHQQVDDQPQAELSATGTQSRSGKTLQLMRKVRRGRLRLPITLSVILMVMNLALMVFWIILAAQIYWWTALAIGTVLFVLILVGLSLYLVLTIKEVRLSQRQSDFIDSVTHELKTPLASLRLYLETLQMRTLSEEKRVEFYATMKIELERLDHLISQLLEVKRLDALGMGSDPEDILIEPLIRHCARVECNRRQLDIDQVFEFDFEPSLIHTRRILLEMIFRNVIDNAIKYGRPGTEITLSARRADRVPASFPGGPTGRAVAIAVRDRGDGIAPQHLPRLTERFYRVDAARSRDLGGTGLGLAIVKHIVSRHRGALAIQSTPGEGSLFTVYIPAAEGAAPARGATAA